MKKLALFSALDYSAMRCSVSETRNLPRPNSAQTMNKYLRPNMSRRAERYTTAFFAICAHVLETAVFVYVGLASAISKAPSTLLKIRTWLGIVTMLVSLAVSRAVAVGALTKVIHLCSWVGSLLGFE